MQRSIFAIPLCIILCIAVFSSSVFALPPNDYNTTVNCTWQLVSGIFGNEFSISSGTLHSWGLWSPDSENYVSLSSYSGSISVSYDLYIAVLTSSLSHVYFEGLDDYYYPAGNITETVSLTPTLMYYDGTPPFKGNIPLNVNVVDSVTFCYFRDVPAGTSFQVNDLNPYPPAGTSFINAYSSYSQSNVNYSLYLFGFYFASAKVTGDQIVSAFKDGSLSFSEAMDSLLTLQDEDTKGTDYTQSLLNLSIIQSQIEEVIRFSDLSFSNLLLDLLINSENLFSSVRTGALSVTDALGSLSPAFTEILSMCQTAEQGSIAFDLYNTLLDRLYFEYEMYESARVSNLISDSVSDHVDSQVSNLLHQENQIFAQFDLKSIEAQIDYETWLYRLPTQEANALKTFLDYILNDSPIKFFVIVPMTLGLISIFLGTRIFIFRGESRPSDEDRYWKSTADNYFNFRGG